MFPMPKVDEEKTYEAWAKQYGTFLYFIKYLIGWPESSKFREYHLTFNAKNTNGDILQFEESSWIDGREVS